MSVTSLRRGLVLAACAFVAATAVAAAPEPPRPRRIASLNLTSDEILVELVPVERLVAVTTFADDEDTSNVRGRVPPHVARFVHARMERLLSLSPDLVVVSEYTDADFLKLLEKSGLRYHRMGGLGSLGEIRGTILDLGQVVGESEAAARLVARLDARLREIEKRLEGVRRPRVLYWSNPYTAGADSAIGALIECGGGGNVGRELGLTGMAPVGAERAFVTDPDVVLVGRSEDSLSALRSHPLLAQMRAVKEGRVLRMPTRLLETLSHHVAESCEFMAASLHPDRVPKSGP